MAAEPDATAEGGREEILKAGEAATTYYRNIQGLTLTQLLYDFGGTGGTIDAFKGALLEVVSRREQVKQEVLIQGISSYLRVIRAREMLKYAKRSEDSIKKLSGMQETLVKRGAGYSYQDLQVKGQLAGSMSFRVTAERTLQSALHNFKSVYNIQLSMDDVEKLKTPAIPRALIPASLDQSVKVALDKNPFIIEVQNTIKRQEGELLAKKSAFWPKFELILEANRKENDLGDPGVRTENKATAYMSYNLFNGFGDMADVSASRNSIVASKRTMLDRRRSVEEAVRNAWTDLATLRKNVELYSSQADITWEFLRLVKLKKEKGADVNLLDILVGERDYISAVSAKVAADIDIILAGYTLLYQMGMINEDVTRL